MSVLSDHRERRTPLYARIGGAVLRDCEERRPLFRRVLEVQRDFWLRQWLPQLQLRAREFNQDEYKNYGHRRFGEDCIFMTQGAERDQSEPETRQRNDPAPILSLQSCRTMRTSQPSPRVNSEEKRGRNVARASRAFRHGAHPFRSCVYCTLELPTRLWNATGQASREQTAVGQLRKGWGRPSHVQVS